MPPYRALVLDLDGTVLDSHRYTFDAFRHACTPFRQPPTDADIFGAFGPAEGVILAHLLRPDEVAPAYARLQDFYARHATRVAVHPSLRALLADAAAGGIRRGLFTGRGGDSTHLLLASLDLEWAFEVIVAGDDMPRPKPAPDGVLHVLAALGCSPGEALVVGDSSLDLQAARAAGVAALFATWYGWSGHPPPPGAACVETPEALRPLLGLPPVLPPFTGP